MAFRTTFLSCAALWVMSLGRRCECRREVAAPTDPFALDCARNIVDEEHFGIADGKATCGIPYRDVFSIAGLCGRPYVSSDFGIGVRVLGQPIIAEHYSGIRIAWNGPA